MTTHIPTAIMKRLFRVMAARETTVFGPLAKDKASAQSLDITALVTEHIGTGCLYSSEHCWRDIS